MPKRQPALTTKRRIKFTSVTELANGLANLKNLDREALRSEWERFFRRRIPLELPQYVLLRMIAYRLQANAVGDLDTDCVKYLNQVARERATRLASKNKRSPKSPPPVPAVPAEHSLKVGSILVREHEGQLHKVIVIEPRGFRWNDRAFKSLSEVAYAITGTKWNGPRFFGLRSEALIQSSPAAGHNL
jgi:hypothetical protein